MPKRPPHTPTEATAMPACSAANPETFARPPVVDVWGLPFACVNMQQTLAAIGSMIADRVPRYLITANLNYVMLAARQAELRAVNRDAAIILADGQPIVWRSRLAGTRLPERVAGSELIYRLAERSAAEGWRIYLLGAAPGVAQRCADAMESLYPGVQIAGVQSPPFRPLSESEQQEQLDQVRQARPDVLLVAFGQPKGELWIHRHYRQLGVPVSIQLGASFDFVAGTAQRAPRLWQRTGLEWAYRMAHDPRRLVPRYADNAAFLLAALARDGWNACHRKPATGPGKLARPRTDAG